MLPRVWILLAALIGASGVGLGAFHAHGLKGWLERNGVAEDAQQKRIDNCETAVRYQMFHAPVLLLIGVWSLRDASRILSVAAVLLLLGLLGFSGGLYRGVFTGNLGHWAIVPAGGACLILSWLALGVSALRQHSLLRQHSMGPTRN